MKEDIPNIDLHLHTGLSLCTHAYSENKKLISYEDYLVNGLDYYGFSDHLHYMTRLDNFLRQTEKSRPFFHSHTNCFLGVESDFVRSSSDITVPKRFRKRFDYIIGSVHMISDTTIGQMTKGPKQLAFLKDIGAKRIISNYVEDMVDTANCSGVKILGHPFVILGFINILDQVTDEDILTVVNVCKQNKVAVEISNSLVETSMESNAFEKVRRLTKLTLENSAKISLGSDAHKIENAGLCSEIFGLLDEFDVRKRNVFLPKKRFL